MRNWDRCAELAEIRTFQAGSQRASHYVIVPNFEECWIHPPAMQVSCEPAPKHGKWDARPVGRQTPRGRRRKQDHQRRCVHAVEVCELGLSPPAEHENISTAVHQTSWPPNKRTSSTSAHTNRHGAVCRLPRRTGGRSTAMTEKRTRRGIRRRARSCWVVSRPHWMDGHGGNPFLRSESRRCWAVSRSYTVLNCRSGWWNGWPDETI